MIVGGTGFIGGHLAEYFFKEGEISKGVFRKGSHLRILDQCGIQCIEADLNDRHTLHEPLDMVDVVYALASPPPGASTEDFEQFNSTSLTNLLEEASEHGAKAFILLSCLDVYGSGGLIDADATPEPRDGYQKGKLSIENTVAAFGKKNPEMKIRIIRAARAVGPRDMTLTVPMLKMAEQGKVVLSSESTEKLSLSHPKDISQALLKAATYTGDQTVFLVKSFDATLEEFCRAVLRASNNSSATLKSGGFFSGRTLIPQYTVEQIRSKRRIENQESWRSLGFSPLYNVERTAEGIVEWQRKEPWATRETV